MSYDLHFECLSPSQAHAAVSEVLGVAAAEIRVVASFEELRPDENPAVFCELVARGGRGYRTTLSVNSHLCTLSESSFARRMVRYLGSPCLISDDAINPFTWLQITPDGHIFPVSVDTEAMGQEEEELVIEWYMYDLHFKRLSPPEASAAVSEVLAVAPAEIRIVADWDELTEGDTPTVRCLLSDGGYGRGYRIGLSVWCKRCTLSKPDFARRMARRLESPCLIADNSVDSFTWLRVTPDGQIRPMERDERIRARYLPPDIQDPEES